MCNITKGAFYHHFKNKDEIYFAALNSLFYEIDKWIREKTYASKTIEELNLLVSSAIFDYRGLHQVTVDIFLLKGVEK